MVKILLILILIAVYQPFSEDLNLMPKLNCNKSIIKCKSNYHLKRTLKIKLHWKVKTKIDHCMASIN